jgi:hypothetical protein
MFDIEIWKIIVTIFVAIIAAVLGGITTHYFNSKRDRELKRKELISTHIINAYRILANDITRREASLERDLKLETLIAELQLFGTIKQILLTKQLTDDIVKGGDFFVDDLLNDLRNQLRRELNLDPIQGNVRWLRFDKNTPEY